MSLPTKCSHQEKYFRCTLPPSYIISIQEGKDEFLVGVYCERHSRDIEVRLASILQGNNDPGRHLKTEKLRFVSTECIRACATNLPISKKPLSSDNGQMLSEKEDS